MKENEYLTSCPNCGAVQLTSKEQCHCEQCKKSFISFKIDQEEIRWETYDTEETIEKKLLDEIQRLKSKDNTTYCLYFNFGNCYVYRPKRFFKRDMFDDYKPELLFGNVEERFQNLYKIILPFSHKYNIEMKPYYWIGRFVANRFFGIALYLSNQDINRIKTNIENSEIEDSNNLFLSCYQNTLGEEKIKKLQASPIIEEVKKYLYKLYKFPQLKIYNGVKYHGDLKIATINVCLSDNAIWFDGPRYENENVISFYQYNYSDIKTIKERNTLFIALYNCIDAFICEYKPQPTHKEYWFNISYEKESSDKFTFYINANVYFSYKKRELESMFE